MASQSHIFEGIDGQWNLGIIHGDTLSLLGIGFRGDPQHTLIARTRTTLKVSFQHEGENEAEHLTAEVKSDGKLHWSDGEVWIRRQVTPTTSVASADLAKAKSIACSISPPDWIHCKLNRLHEAFYRKLTREQEVFMEQCGADGLAKEMGFSWRDPDIDDPDRLVKRSLSQYRLGHDPQRISDTMPIYKASFHLLRHPHTGIFHSSNAVKIVIKLLGALSNEMKELEMFAELIGGNFRRDRLPKSECCLRLRLWPHRKYMSHISVASIFWPDSGCMVDAKGKQVPIENWADDLMTHLGRDTTDFDTSVEDRIDEIALPEDVDKAWEEGCILPGCLNQAWQDSCSAFTLPLGRRPPEFRDFAFSQPSGVPYQQAYFASLYIRRWTHASVRLPESSVHLILACLFETYCEDSFCFHGVLAVAAGVRQSRQKRKIERRRLSAQTPPTSSSSSSSSDCDEAN